MNGRLTQRLAQMLAASATLALLPGASLAAQISVSPVDFTLAPTGPRTGAFTVTNDSKVPQQLTFYANDWDRNQAGQNRFYPLGTLPYSCRTRLQIFPQALRVLPGESQSVRVSLLPGDSSSAPCWTIVFAETAPNASGSGSRIAFVTRLGVKVYLTAGSATRDGAIDSMAVTPHLAIQGNGPDTSGAKLDLVVGFRNTGTAPLTVRGSVEFRTLDNASAARVKIDEIPVLPGAARDIRVPVPATLKPGRYVGLAVLSFGGADDVAAQAEVDVR